MVIVDQHEYLCEEEKRLKDDRERKRYWKKWGPYVAERQWATGILPDVKGSEGRINLLMAQYSERGLLVRSPTLLHCLTCLTYSTEKMGTLGVVGGSLQLEFQN